MKTSAPFHVLNTPQDVRQFQSFFRLRDDWHEPDEQGITAEVIGHNLDNAMGFEPQDLETGTIEQVVVLKHEGVPVAGINLATLLSLASR